MERNNCRQRHWFSRFKRKYFVISRAAYLVDLTMFIFANFHANGNIEQIKKLGW